MNLLDNAEFGEDALEILEYLNEAAAEDGIAFRLVRQDNNQTAIFQAYQIAEKISPPIASKAPTNPIPS